MTSILRRLAFAGLLGLCALLNSRGGAAQSMAPATDPDAQSPEPPLPLPSRSAQPSSAPLPAPPSPSPDPSVSSESWVAPLGVVITPGIDILAQYSLRFFEDAAGESTWFHEIELPRAQGSLGASYKAARARFVLEAVRSASEGALIGVAGDSLVMRVREGYAGVEIEDRLEIRLGIVPTLSIGSIERAWGARAITPTALERTGIASPADLGGTLKYSLPRELGWIAVGAYNGEGYARRELNRGKNFELAAEIRPFALVPAARNLAVFGSFVAGSAGTGRARANRITAGLFWEGGGDNTLGKVPAPASSIAERIRAGAALTYALGVDGDGARTSLLVDAFLRVEPINRFILAGDVQVWDLDVNVPSDTITTLSGAAGFRIVEPIEAFLAIDRILVSGRAIQAVPGLDTWRLRLISRVVF